MTTITIKSGPKLSRTSFENWEDFQIEYLLMQENIDLSPDHIDILKYREKEADNATDEGFSWKEVKSNITRNNV